MLSAKPESSAESATQRLSSAVGGRNAAVFHDSVARHAHAARTGDVLIEAGRARLHVDVAGAGNGKLQPVDAAIGAGAAAAGDGQTQIVLIQTAELHVPAAAGQAHMVQGNAADNDVHMFPLAPAIAAEAALALADANLVQHFVGTGDADAGRTGAHIMHRGGNRDAKTVTAIPGPFPMTRLLERRFARGEVVPVARGGRAGEKHKNKSRFPINPHRWPPLKTSRRFRARPV